MIVLSLMIGGSCSVLREIVIRLGIVAAGRLRIEMKLLGLRVPVHCSQILMVDPGVSQVRIHLSGG